MITVHKLLLAKTNKLPDGKKVSTFQGPSCTETPTWSARTLQTKQPLIHSQSTPIHILPHKLTTKTNFQWKFKNKSNPNISTSKVVHKKKNRTFYLFLRNGYLIFDSENSSMISPIKIGRKIFGRRDRVRSDNWVTPWVADGSIEPELVLLLWPVRLVLPPLEQLEVPCSA